MTSKKSRIERYDVRFDGCRLQADTLEKAIKIKADLETWVTDAGGNRRRYRDVIIVDMETGKEVL